MAGKLAQILSDLKEPEALAYVDQALGEGKTAEELLEDAKEGMSIVGDRFSSGEYYIPDLIFSGEILKGIVQKLEPKIKANNTKEIKRSGKVVVGTVAGDIHDIGKDLVVFMLDVSGFDVTDLGVDVPVQKFVDAVKTNNSSSVPSGRETPRTCPP